MLNVPIYLDNNATTPCDPRVLEAMLPWFTNAFGNAASRNHSFGWQAAEAVTWAREQLAQLLGADPTEIIFTSGATEADNLAIKGVAEAYTTKGTHIITCATEHKAVLDTCHHLQKTGSEITWLPVNNEGRINLHELEAAIRPTTILIALMYANNETGVLQPITDISTIARKHNILFFTDATQAVGKIPINVHESNIALLALSAHKMYGPKGVGALYVRRKDPRVRLTAQMDGGGHERGIRSGTLNVPGIVGLGKAAELCRLEMETEAKRLFHLRNRLEQSLLQLPGVYVNGSQTHRLAHVTNLSFQHVDGNALLLGLTKTIAVSSGSACTSASMDPSYVLKAMGVEDNLAYASIRFAIGRFSTEEEIDYTIHQVTTTLQQLRALNPTTPLT